MSDVLCRAILAAWRSGADSQVDVMVDDRDARIARPEPENAGLREAKHALREQRAPSAESLHVIASSPTELPRVFATLAESACRLGDGQASIIWLVEHGALRCVAATGLAADNRLGTSQPPSPTTMSGRAIIEGQVLYIEDVETTANRREYPDSRRRGNRTTLHVPLVRGSGRYTLTRPRLDPGRPLPCAYHYFDIQIV
jgi:GAF domain